jgi:alpha-beta hydrolase superfamily lysophospholipase
LDKDKYKCRIDGVMLSGGMIHVKKDFLPPQPIVNFLLFLSNYYPKLIMPATDFESTFDEAFGDKEWARTSRQDPKIVMSIRPTLGSIAATLGTGKQVMGRTREWSVPLLAIHGKNDCRTELSNMQHFVDLVNKNSGGGSGGKAAGDDTAALATLIVMDTNGHQLLQDLPDITHEVIDKFTNWITTKINQN